MKNHVGECGNGTNAKLSRCVMILDLVYRQSAAAIIQMKTTLQSIRIYIVLTLLTGIIYPLAMTELRVNVLQLSRLLDRLHRRRLPA